MDENSQQVPGKCLCGTYESGSLPACRSKIRSPKSPGFTRRYLSPNRRIVEGNAEVTADFTQRGVGEGIRTSGWISALARASTWSSYTEKVFLKDLDVEGGCESLTG